MRIIYLVLHNLKKLILKNKVIFLLVMISMSCSAFGILFYSGYVGTEYYSRMSDNGDSVDISIAENISETQLTKLIEQFENDTVTPNCIRLSENSDEQLMKHETIIEGEELNLNEIHVSIIGEYNERYNKRLSVGRTLDKSEDGAVVVIPEDYIDYLDYDDTPLNAKINLDNHEFSVVGVMYYSDTDGIIVPINYYIQNLLTKNIKIGYDHSLSSAENKAVESILEKSDIIEEYQWTRAESALESFDFWIDFFQIILIFIVIILNVFVVIYFLISRMKRYYSICSLCGSVKRNNHLIILLQTFLLLLIGIIIGTVLFVIILPCLHQVKLIDAISLEFYLAVDSLMIVIVFIISAIMGALINRNITVYQTTE